MKRGQQVVLKNLHPDEQAVSKRGTVARVLHEGFQVRFDRYRDKSGKRGGELHTYPESSAYLFTVVGG